MGCEGAVNVGVDFVPQTHYAAWNYHHKSLSTVF